MTKHSTSIRVRYKETDQMGVAYYSNYLVWFEVARAELFRNIGCPYKEIEDVRGLRLMVIEASCRYKLPARYDDLLDIICSISELGKTSMRFKYSVKRGSDLLADGETLHVFTDVNYVPKRMPKQLKEAIS
jgi:acyl-CoA thioester hydrolase